ncbi:MAG TPA: H-NS histone family protein [Thermoanaerobaculia bacterium]|nr:H-NS histone family protein [Thermoanaerobaculia bacterium]
MAKANSIDLSKLSLEELEGLAREIETEITGRRQAEKERVLQQMRELAASIGTTPEDLFRRTGKVAEKVTAVKYRHPDDPSLTWAGRGKRPQWVVDALAAGKTLDDLAAG